jgi:hypothetical protein|tara:strand:- start:7012 stop:7389 length:378 start_codon:yes stop_codon:yes gene_type:complete
MAIKRTYNPKWIKSRNKYGAKKTVVDGITFDSKWESERYGQLKAMERGGIVTELELQVSYDITVNKHKICKYIADFRYKLEHANGSIEDVVEDAKGVETPEFKLKKKLMKAIYNIDIYLSKKTRT